MLAQGLLGFQYESDRSSGGLTSLAGLPLYLELIQASGLGTAIRQHVSVAGSQGWLDFQMVLAVVFLNLAGGDCVEDLERLEQDSGFAAILEAIEHALLSRAVPRPGLAESGCRFGGHSGGDGSLAELVAGERGVSGLRADAPANDIGDAGHGRDVDWDAQAGCVALLQEVQGVSAVELLVGRSTIPSFHLSE